jgi:hypothetical protein
VGRNLTSEDVAALLDPQTCDQYGRRWLDSQERWRACRVDLPDDRPVETFVFCPGCAAAEFGE